MIFQANGKTGPKPYRPASHSAIRPPATTRSSAEMIKTDKTIVNPMAVSLVFHHGRVSFRSYAVLSEVVIALSPFDAAHNAARMPNDNFPPPLAAETSNIVESIS